MSEKKKCFLQKAAKDDPNLLACSKELIQRDHLGPNDARILHITSGCRKSLKHVCSTHLARFLTSFSSFEKICCDPFETHEKSKLNPPPSKKVKVQPAQRSLEVITLTLRDKVKDAGFDWFSKMVPGRKLCVTCKLKVYKGIKLPIEGEKPFLVSPLSAQSSQQTLTPQSPLVISQGDVKDKEYNFEDLTQLNGWLEGLGLSPISLVKLKTRKSYGHKALNKIKTALLKSGNYELEDEDSSSYKEIIQQLKDFIKKNPEPSKKILALSVIPKSWSYSKTELTLDVSSHLVRKARKIVEEKGILSTPNPKPGKSLSEETVQHVKNFFLREDVSRILPGMNDNISVKVNGERTHMRKRLVLSTLYKLHQDYTKEFQETYPVSLSKFCELRPQQCVLAGKAGTRVVCVCTYHQNVELMFEGGKLKNSGFQSVKDCFKMLLCPQPTRDCYLRQCENCPDSLALQEKLELYFDSEVIDSVTFNEWERPDRGNLVTQTLGVDDFSSKFITLIDELIPHHYTAKQQALFYRKKKEQLTEGEIIVSLDFAENYSFVIQESSQSSYFKNKEATVHPVVVHYKQDEKIQVKSFVVISDHLQHSTAAVHTFLAKVIEIVTVNLKIDVKNICYFSDGCSGQYKNKFNVANVWAHQRDFGITAEWHFHATSHGKSECDGVGGMIKHQAMLYSLRVREAGKQITTARALCDFVEKNIKGVVAVYVSSSEVLKHEQQLEVRFQLAYDIDGVKSHHAIIPDGAQSHILMKRLSTDSMFVIRKVSTKEFKLEYDEVKGFVIYSPDFTKLLLGCATSGDKEMDSFSIQQLKPTGKTNAFEFSDDTVDVFLDNIVCCVNPFFQAKGKIIKLYAGEVKAAQLKLSNMSKF